MGKSLSTIEPPAKDDLTRLQFDLICVIGRGGYGRVWKALHRPSSTLMALKQMQKGRIIARRCVQSVLNERRLLTMVKHPFIVNMQFAFQDQDCLYLAMDLMTGGDLRYHLMRHRTFTQEQTRFFVACTVTALEYLHVNNITHRDIKPENLVLDSRGYLRITDFGIAREGAHISENSGTPGYMAPEVMLRQPHGISADYYALGVLVFEFMKGVRPYQGKTRREIREKMLSKQTALKRSDVPPGWSIEAADFVNKLLARKQTERLGFKGPLELKNHAWLRDFQWKKVMEKSLEAPFRPGGLDNYESGALSEPGGDQEPRFEGEGYQGLFEGYYFRSSQRGMPEASTVSLH